MTTPLTIPRTLPAVLDQIAAMRDDLARTAEQCDREGRFVADNVRRALHARLHWLPVPREYGGDGFDLLACAQVLQHLARADASTALGMAMHFHVIGALAEHCIWHREAFARLCRSVVVEDALVNSAASEPEMGSPSRGGLPATRAIQVAGGFCLNGHKRWVTWAPALRFFLVTATLEDAIGVFVVDARTPGVQLVDTWSDSLSLRGSGSFDVILRDVFVAEEWLVERRAPGQARRGGLPTGWSICAFAAVYLGVGEGALEAIARYATQRVPTALGKPIAELPHIQRLLGQAEVTLRAARAVLHDVARRWSEQPEARTTMEADLAAAKHLCTNAAITVTDLAMRAAGAAGLERTLPLERYLRDARAGLMHPPQDDRALELLGKAAVRRAAA